MNHRAEVCLHTRDVPRLSQFYQELLHTPSDGEDPVHQSLDGGGFTLSFYNDGHVSESGNARLSLAFTVEDVDACYLELLMRGVPILEAPMTRPWGARNLLCRDPDGNTVALRCFL